MQKTINKAKISIVVAVYNESTCNLHALIEQLEKAVSPLNVPYEIVFVNDGSKEDTSTCLNELVQSLDYVKLISLSRNFGQQAAISAGIDFASGEAIITMDSDLQDPPSLVPDMVHLWQKGYEVVYARRSSRKDRWAKQLTAFLFYRMMALLSSTSIPRDTGEFRLIDRRVADCLKRLPERSRYIRGLIPWLGFRQTTIQVDRHARQHGESSYTLKKLVALAFDGILYFSYAPLYAVSIIGVMTILASFLTLVAGQIFIHNHNHLLLLMAVTVFIFLSGLQFLLLGIVGLYVAKIFHEVRARPIYVISSIAGRGFDMGEEKTSSKEIQAGSRFSSSANAYPFNASPVLSDYHQLFDNIS